MRSLRSIPPLAIALSLIAAAPAAATTVCVPTFHPACQNHGANVAQPNLQTAMQTDGKDGIPDLVIIAAGTVTRADSYQLSSGDTDPLEVVGAGPEATAITTSESGNPYVMDLSGSRSVTMRDLTIRIPFSFVDDGGGGIQAEKGVFENVDIESRNPGSDGASSMIGGGTFRDGRLYGSNGGSIDDGFRPNAAESGSLTIERTTIEDAAWGIHANTVAVPVFLRGVRIVDPTAYGVRISKGGFAVVDNSIIETSGAGQAVVAEADDPGTVIGTVRHTTIVGTNMDPNTPAVRATVMNQAGNGSINLVLTDSIVEGYNRPLYREAPVSPSIGGAGLTARYSLLAPDTFSSGDGTLSKANDIDITSFAPAFAGTADYHLKPGSPAIDVGDPLVASLPTADYDGAPRPVDGNGDGTARRDMGAFEYQPPVAPPADPPAGQPDPGAGPGADPGPGGSDPGPGPGPGPGPKPPAKDTTRPVLGKPAFKSVTVRRGGKFELTSSEAATIELTFTPKKGKAVRVRFKVKAGRNKLVIKARKLAARSFKVTAVATDAAGNRSKTARAKLTVRR